MEARRITSQEQQCISRCITSHWGQEVLANDDALASDSEERDRSYEQCLGDCRICG